eukprot:TRINITY_DN1423_c0_g5_i1.p1 TRINITY_DN1423_c0_g5~~TRINITY_DN1423_c0_g5_i1.p1  ORF type:complete len:109 (-),score=23.63 TRINITY_DN1423_c0_g5_i1:145-471(-)
MVHPVMSNEMFVADLLWSPYRPRDRLSSTPGTNDAPLDKENALTIKRKQRRDKKLIGKNLKSRVVMGEMKMQKDGGVIRNEFKGYWHKFTKADFDLKKETEGYKKLPR